MARGVFFVRLFNFQRSILLTTSRGAPSQGFDDAFVFYFFLSVSSGWIMSSFFFFFPFMVGGPNLSEGSIPETESVVKTFPISDILQ